MGPAGSQEPAGRGVHVWDAVRGVGMGIGEADRCVFELMLRVESF